MSVQDDPQYGAANNPGGYEGEIYSPANEPGFNPQEQSGRRAMLLLAGGFGGLLLLALILLKVYSPGTRADGEPPRILADTSPYKSAPENPGGEQIPNQDKTVYDVISGETRSDTVNIVPDGEDPVVVKDSATIIVKNQDGSLPAPAATAPAVTSPTVQTPAVTSPAQTYIGGGSNYVVQVASLRSDADAKTAWTNLNRKVGDMIPAALYSDIKRVDLNEKGIRHRLRVAGFADKASASKFCERLKARNQDCIVVTK